MRTMPKNTRDIMQMESSVSRRVRTAWSVVALVFFAVVIGGTGEEEDGSIPSEPAPLPWPEAHQNSITTQA